MYKITKKEILEFERVLVKHFEGRRAILELFVRSIKVNESVMEFVTKLGDDIHYYISTDRYAIITIILCEKKRRQNHNSHFFL